MVGMIRFLKKKRVPVFLKRKRRYLHLLNLFLWKKSKLFFIISIKNLLIDSD